MQSSLEDRTLPPPPPEGDLEVSIRTFASDLELIQQSGGVISSFITGATLNVDATGAVKNIAAPSVVPRDRSPFIIWGIVFVVGTVVLFLVGYYFVPTIVNMFTGGNTPTGQNAPSTKPGMVQNNNGNPTTQPLSFGHTSFLKTQPPTINLDLFVSGLPPDRGSFIREVIAKTANGPAFFEIIPLGAEERPLTWLQLTALLGANDFNKNFLADHFSRDYTMVVARVKDAVYPTYIFKLNPGESPLLLQRDALAIEQNPSAFARLFFTDPGAVVGGFTDAQVGGQPMRSLSFVNSFSSISYGWFFNTYLIISTNEAGLRGAIEHL